MAKTHSTTELWGLYIGMEEAGYVPIFFYGGGKKYKPVDVENIWKTFWFGYGTSCFFFHFFLGPPKFVEQKMLEVRGSPRADKNRTRDQTKSRPLCQNAEHWGVNLIGGKMQSNDFDTFACPDKDNKLVKENEDDKYKSSFGNVLVDPNQIVMRRQHNARKMLATVCGNVWYFCHRCTIIFVPRELVVCVAGTAPQRSILVLDSASHEMTLVENWRESGPNRMIRIVSQLQRHTWIDVTKCARICNMLFCRVLGWVTDAQVDDRKHA